MVFVGQKFALNLAGDFSLELEKIISDSNIKIIENVNEIDHYTISYIFVKNHIGSYSRYNDLYNTVDREISIISLSDVTNKNDFLSYSGRAVINESFLKASVPKIIVNKLLTKRSTLKLESTYENVFKSFKSIKITSGCSSGYYSDLLGLDASRLGFEEISVKNYLIGILSYLERLKYLGVISFPVEVDYGESENEFVIQVYAPSNRFVMEYINNSFQSGSTIDGYKVLCNMCSALTDVFDIYFLSSTSKIVLTGAWLKKSFLDPNNYYPMLLVNNIDSFREVQNEWKQVKESPEIAINQARSDLSAELERRDIPKEYLDILVSKAAFLVNYPVLLQKFVDYIYSIRERETYPKDINIITISDVGGYLFDYPQRKLVKKLQDPDKELILKALQNPSIIVKITEAIEEFNKSIENDAEAKNKYIDQVSESFDALGFEEASNFLHGDKPSDENQNQMVKGRIDEDNSKTMIKESPENIDDAMSLLAEINNEDEIMQGDGDKINEEVFKVSDKGFDLDEEIWNEIRGKLLREVKILTRKIKDEGGSVSKIEAELTQLFSVKLDISETDSRMLVQGVLENAKGLFANNELFEELKNAVESYGEEIGEIQLLEEISNKNEKISRMSKVIDALKIDLNSKKQIEMAIGSEAPEIENLKSKLSKAYKALESRDLVISRLKHSTREHVEDKNVAIDQLKEQVGEMAKNRLDHGDALDMQEFLKLKEEHKAYKGLIEISNRRIVQMSDNINKLKKQTSSLTNDGEFYKLKEVYKIASQQLENQKEENLKLRSKIKLLNEKVKTPPKSDITLEENSSDDYIATLKNDANNLTEKLRSANLQIKELSQKVVYLEATTPSASSGKGSGQSGGVGVKGLEHKVKQLESLNEKLTSSNKKAQSDLTSGKKEIMTLKSENAVHKSALQIFEKKIDKYKHEIEDYEARIKRG